MWVSATSPLGWAKYSKVAFWPLYLAFSDSSIWGRTERQGTEGTGSASLAVVVSTKEDPKDASLPWLKATFDTALANGMPFYRCVVRREGLRDGIWTHSFLPKVGKGSISFLVARSPRDLGWLEVQVVANEGHHGILPFGLDERVAYGERRGIIAEHLRRAKVSIRQRQRDPL